MKVAERPKDAVPVKRHIVIDDDDDDDDFHVAHDWQDSSPAKRMKDQASSSPLDIRTPVAKLRQSTLSWAVRPEAPAAASSDVVALCDICGGGFGTLELAAHTATCATTLTVLIDDDDGETWD